MADNNTSVAKVASQMGEVILSRMTELTGSRQLMLPENYSMENALKEAFLKLQTIKNKSGVPALQCCTQTSIYNALMDMCIQGLHVSNAQCYFIVYGDQLQLQRSYFGTQVVTKRLRSDIAKDGIKAGVIRQGQEYVLRTTEDGLIVADVQNEGFTLEALDAPIIGAWCTIKNTEGKVLASEVMTIKQIQQSWSQSKMNWQDKSSTHSKFSEEMAKKTILNRTCKNLINTSDDASIISGAYRRTLENEYKDVTPVAEKPATTEKGVTGIKARIAEKKAVVEEPKVEESKVEEEVKTEYSQEYDAPAEMSWQTNGYFASKGEIGDKQEEATEVAANGSNDIPAELEMTDEEYNKMLFDEAGADE